MELFEILFIALVILFPILEQVLRRGRKGGDEPGSESPDPGARGSRAPGPAPLETRPGEVSPRSAEREPVKAADMVPDDLWAVLTGEERPREGVEADREERPAATAEPRAEPPAAEPPPAEEPARWEEAWTPRAEPRWRMDDVEEAPAPVSLEHHGPEAYSLETFEREPVSLETPLDPPDVRHRRFHESIASPPLRRTRRSPIGRALRSTESLRQAFVLSEVLRPPKGLE